MDKIKTLSIDLETFSDVDLANAVFTDMLSHPHLRYCCSEFQ